MKVAIIGTVGVPANYGGFETLVENLIGEHCSADIEYTVFCSSKDMPNKMVSYKNAKLEYVPFHANGGESLIYDFVSLWKVMKGYDVILYLGASIPILKLYKRLSPAKIILNIDGLSQFRDKYSYLEKKYLSYIKDNEITRADVIIADNKGIQEYVTKEYGLPSELIAYGGDQVLMELDKQQEETILSSHNLLGTSYAISVCRIEPENNCHMILEAFKETNKNIFFVGNWNKSEYGRNLRRDYEKYDNIILHDPIYDLQQLYALRKNAKLYIHGHSVGGTNPSLVEAMFFGKPILCFDVSYNRATTFNKANYFKSKDELKELITNNNVNGEELKTLAFENYTWKHIVAQYEESYKKALSL